MSTVCATGPISGVTSRDDADAAPPSSTTVGVTLGADAAEYLETAVEFQAR